MGTVVKSPLLVPQMNGKYVKQLLVLPISDHQISDDNNSCDDYQSETQRLCNNSNDKNYPSINWILFKGIIFSGLSGALFSMCSVIVKYLKDINPGELAVFRFVAIFVLSIPLVIRNGSNPLGPPELRKFLILRGVVGATQLFFSFFAFRFLPIADASVIIFSSPVFVSIFACVFLDENCDILQISSVILTMVGLILTTKAPIIFGESHPSDHQFINSTLDSIFINSPHVLDSHKDFITAEKSQHIYGVLSALTAIVFNSLVFIFIRKAKGAHHSVIMFNFGWVAIVETVLITALMDGFSMPKSWTEWSLIVLIGLFSFLGQIFLTRSLQLEQAGPVSVVRAATDIALAFVWQLWLFDTTPDVWSITGAFLVTSCILITSVRKWIVSLPDHSRLKLKFHSLIS